MGLRRTVDATAESFSPEIAKKHLTVSAEDDDSYIRDLITTARMYLENLTRRALPGPQTWQWKMRGFPCGVIYVPRPPLLTVSSITYLDGQGASQTVSSSLYVVSNAANEFDEGKITLAYGQFWPTTYGQQDDVTITFTAGYSTLPKPLYHAQLLVIEKLYEGLPESEIQPTIDELIGQYVMERAG